MQLYMYIYIIFFFCIFGELIVSIRSLEVLLLFLMPGFSGVYLLGGH